VQNKIHSRTYRVKLAFTENSGVTSCEMTEQAGQVWPRYSRIAPPLTSPSPLMDRPCKQAHTGMAGR
jgi:hypothetical protein